MKDLQRIFTKLIDFLFKKRSKRAFSRDPYSVWRNLLLGSIVIAFGLIAFSGYFFYKLNQDNFFTAQTSLTQPVVVFDKNIVKIDNDFYDAEETSFRSIQGSAAASRKVSTSTSVVISTTTQATSTKPTVVH